MKKKAWKRIFSSVIAVAVAISMIPAIGSVSGGKIGVETAKAALEDILLQEYTKEVDLTTSIYNGETKQVRIEWAFNATFTSGTYVERVDLETEQIENRGTVKSDYGYNMFYDTSISEGASYMYRLVNGDERSNWSGAIEIPDPRPTGSPRLSLYTVTGKRITLVIRAVNGAASKYDTILQRSFDQRNWKTITTFKAGSDYDDDHYADEIQEDQDKITTVYYRACYKDSTGTGDYSDIFTAKTQKVTIQPLTIDSIQCMTGLMEASISIKNDISTRSDVYTFTVFVDGKKYKDLKMTNANFVTLDIPLYYGKYKTIKVQAYYEYQGKRVYAGKAFTRRLKSAQMKATVLNGATKINSKLVGISWDKVGGAQYYDIYMGKKKVKTVKAPTTYTTVKKKGAAKGKYKVVARLVEKIGKKTTTYTNKALCKKTVKPQANKKVYYKGSKDPTNWAWKCGFSVQSVKLSGSTYTVTGYAINHRYATCKMWKKFTIKVMSGGKVVAKKTYKNYKLNLKGISSGKNSKKITFKIKGKKNKDIFLLGDYSTSASPVW